MDKMEEKKHITISSGWAGMVMTVLLVAIRAFQPNAEPMSDWSFKSWVMLTLPMLFPLWILAGFLLVKASFLLIEGLLEAFSRKRR